MFNDWARAYEFLAREARLLDQGALDDWLQLLCNDIEYLVPVRATRYGEAQEEFSRTSFHFEEDRYSLGMRVKRLDTRFAWAEDPPTRTRHLVGNVLCERQADGNLSVVSTVLLHRSRLDEGVGETLTGERQDVLREVDGLLRLARRIVLLDQTTLPVSTLSTFL